MIYFCDPPVFFRGESCDNQSYSKPLSWRYMFAVHLFFFLRGSCENKSYSKTLLWMSILIWNVGHCGTCFWFSESLRRRHNEQRWGLIYRLVAKKQGDLTSNTGAQRKPNSQVRHRIMSGDAWPASRCYFCFGQGFNYLNPCNKPVPSSVCLKGLLNFPARPKGYKSKQIWGPIITEEPTMNNF
jgi:hypothetical protein